ncbi:MAG TPA: STAS domain-containing protein [Candidatus Baltobacteraceae bacterium]|jgi:anti-anti-sigma factor|nr:STAS domain-containing protein [Candidatus Baltobacteraceae bacterium]
MDGRRDAIVTSLKEPFTVTDERALKAAVLAHLRELRLIHVVDLAELHGVTTSLMNTLLALYRAIQQKHGVLALVIAKPDAMRAFEISGLDGLFTIFPEVAEAVRAAEACARDPRDRLQSASKIVRL